MQGSDGTVENDEPVRDARTRLIGWKRISGHLGCSDRTARRWEQDEALPVHRQLHESKSTVFAFPDELDAWLASRVPSGASEEGIAPGSRMMSNWTRAAPLIVIAALVAAMIGFVAISDPIPKAPEAVEGSSDPIAADLFERGRALWLERGKVPNTRAIKLLEQAVERDPSHAEAWAALSSAWLTIPTYDDDISDKLSVDKAILAADRALALDPTLGEPRVVKATIARRNGDWFRSEEVFEDALRAAPNNPTVYLWYTEHYRELGMVEEAKALIDKALELDPNSPPAQLERAMNMLQVDIDESTQQLGYLWFDIGFQTPVVWTGLWMSHIFAQDFERAQAWVAQNTFMPQHNDLMAQYVGAKQSGDRQAADTVADDILEAHTNGLPAWLGFFMIADLGLPDKALDLAEREVERAGQFDVSVVMFDRHYPAHRQTERFANLTERLGFTEYWRARGAPPICKNEPEAPYCQRTQQQ